MALSRIWSAFIIIAILVASYRCFIGHDTTIFSRMMSGTANDGYDTVRYVLLGSPEKAGFADQKSYTDYLLAFGYKQADSSHHATVLIVDNTQSDTGRILSASD